MDLLSKLQKCHYPEVGKIQEQLLKQGVDNFLARRP